MIIERNQKISEMEQSSFFLLQISENKLHEETISENVSTDVPPTFTF
jgi:hypothetical protein